MTDSNAAARRREIRNEYEGSYMATYRSGDEPAMILALCDSRKVAEFACNDHYNNDYGDDAAVLDPAAWTEPEPGFWTMVVATGTYGITLLPGGITVAMTFADDDGDSGG